MDKAFYELDQQTKTIITELLSTCKKVDLGNVGFNYFPKPNSKEVQFHLAEYKDYWELVVSTQRQDRIKIYWNCRDIYRISDDMQIVYKYSESDLE